MGNACKPAPPHSTQRHPHSFPELAGFPHNFETQLCQIFADHEQAVRRLLREAASTLTPTAAGFGKPDQEEDPIAVQCWANSGDVVVNTGSEGYEPCSKSKDWPVAMESQFQDVDHECLSQQLHQEGADVANHEPESTALTNETLGSPEDTGTNEACRPVLKQSSTAHSALQVVVSVDDIRSYVRKQNVFTRFSNGHRVNDLMEWWDKLVEPPRVGSLASIIKSTTFEFSSIAIIMMNCVYTIVATDWRMDNLKDGTSAMRIIEATFTAFFAVELALKLKVHRLYYFCNKDMGWNIFDLSLVTSDAVDQLIFMRGQSGFNFSLGRMLRLFKLARILRFIRVLHFFTELRLMLACLLGSVASLMWSLMLIAFIKLMFAIVLVQLMTDYVIQNSGTFTEKTQAEIEQSFGSVWHAAFTLLLGVTGGQDWVDGYRIVELSGGFAAGVYVFYMLFMWISVTNVITSIFVENAMTFAKPALDDMMLASCQQDLVAVHELKELFLRIDRDKSYSLSLEEFKEALADVEIRSYFDLKGLSISNADMFFQLLISISGASEVDLDTFVSGCLRMKGYATNVDIMSLSQRVMILAHGLRDFMEEYKQDTAQLGDLLAKIPQLKTGVLSL